MKTENPSTWMNPDTFRVLRRITLFTFVPCLMLVLPQSILTCSIFPAMGLMPMFFSACHGLYSLYHPEGHWIASCSECFLAVWLAAFFGTCVPFVIADPYYWTYYHGGPALKIMGMYGSFMLFFNFLIHCFFIYRAVPGWLRWARLPRDPVCPNCHCSITNIKTVRFHDDHKVHGEYHDDPSEDGMESEPRTSMSTSVLTPYAPSVATVVSADQSGTLV
ncbi:hypothetical protein K431DRAFT_287006 [Polychaeton citri CBS 116435]|uniref:Uncharacterized protein n=1 Tax=Polychaeton citri CBS 116435 TaxID=1314669 RepID=A0A9P4Q6W8_9PEZI|nr:hypothetical protein K431DRAFT_287006 [Polychaeton citri CBS 116435]